MPRPKQNDLPSIEGEGVAPKRIKEIDVAADNYVEVRDTRMTWTKKECDARDKAVALMQKHGLAAYQYGDHEVKLKTGKLSVKVKTIDAPGEKEEED